ncbi:hypothetical protein pb186bvf_001472 [Paramecium bursaria]
MESFRALRTEEEKQLICPNCRQEIVYEDLKLQEPINLVYVLVQFKEMEKLVQLNPEKNIQYLYEYLYSFDETVYNQDLEINNKIYSLQRDGQILLKTLQLDNFSKIIVRKKQNGSFNLFVRLIFNETVIVEVQNDMTIKQLCQLIAIKAGTDPEYYRYTFASKQFDYNTQGKVGDYPFQENATIHQLQRLKGGLQSQIQINLCEVHLSSLIQTIFLLCQYVQYYEFVHLQIICISNVNFYSILLVLLMVSKSFYFAQKSFFHICYLIYSVMWYAGVYQFIYQFYQLFCIDNTCD